MEIDIFEVFAAISENPPLVHHITNWVTIYDCAQICRCAGALPVMAHAKEEAGDMTNVANAIVLNIGTLTPELVDAMILAGEVANKNGIPVVLDAVGAGATPLRTDSCRKILDKIKVDVIKGNLGEIATLSGLGGKVRGVESVGADAKGTTIAESLAKKENATVVITGGVDVISDGKRTFEVANGTPMMSKVVGTGCMAGTLIGAFCAVEKDYTKAATCALSCYGIAGELAARKSSSPMEFKTQLFDSLFSLNKDCGIEPKIKQVR